MQEQHCSNETKQGLKTPYVCKEYVYFFDQSKTTKIKSSYILFCRHISPIQTKYNFPKVILTT